MGHQAFVGCVVVVDPFYVSSGACVGERLLCGEHFWGGCGGPARGLPCLSTLWGAWCPLSTTSSWERGVRRSLCRCGRELLVVDEYTILHKMICFTQCAPVEADVVSTLQKKKKLNPKPNPKSSRQTLGCWELWAPGSSGLGSSFGEFSLL